jgi:hypothetical protein
MKKNLRLLLILLAVGSFCSLNLTAQSTRKDFDSTTMSIVSIVISKSSNLSIPDKMIKELKSFALQNNLEENLVLKNSIVLKMLFNKDLSYNEKKVYLEWAIQNYTTESKYLPITYFKEALAALKQ